MGTLLSCAHIEQVCAFFRSLAVACDIEINELSGERIYGELLDIEELEEDAEVEPSPKDDP